MRYKGYPKIKANTKRKPTQLKLSLFAHTTHLGGF